MKYHPKTCFVTSSHSKRFFQLVLFCFCLNQPGHAGSSIRLNTTGQPPLNSEDKNSFMDQVTQHALTQLNIQLETVQLPAERGLINANSGVEDGEMSRIGGLQKLYPNLIQVPEKIMDWEFVAFSNKNINLDHGWQSLANHSVAIINGWKILEENVPASAELIKVKNPSQLFNLLILNRTDIVLYEKWGGLSIIQTQNLKNIRLLSPILAKREMYTYFHKKHSKLIKPFSEALFEMKSNGEYQKLYDQILTPLADNLR